ncbi:hypothetical protein CHS0354_025702 [Potamilus streckersoni]|uniref:G-protein coupled receptors family 1 profile domain-containing protein n=1 Tax=Potamilus streckersoni TaxID=2493646 RepID=A0AAE0VM01_9BIVA|nr:hypothetical protein CHS0354_025702 [Potamilus streckersoni]
MFTMNISNYSTYFVQRSVPSLDELNDEEIYRLVPLLVYLILISIIGIGGNGLVCYIYKTKYRLSNSQSFILCLSAIDLFACFVVVPLEFFTILRQFHFEAIWACKLSRFSNTFVTMSSSFLLLAIAVDRYRKVCKSFGWQISSNAARALCVASILAGLAVSWPALILYGKKSFLVQEFNITATECSINDAISETMFPFLNNLMFSLMFLTGIVAMSLLYCFIGRVICQHAKKPREYLNVSVPMLSSAVVDSKPDDLPKQNDYQKRTSRRKSSKREKGELSWAGRSESSRKDDHSVTKDDLSFNTVDNVNASTRNAISMPVVQVEHKWEGLMSDDSGIKADQQRPDDDSSGKYIFQEGTNEKVNAKENDADTDVDSNNEKDETVIETEEKNNSTASSKGNFSKMHSPSIGEKINRITRHVSSALSVLTSRSSREHSHSFERTQYLKEARARRTASLMFVITLTFILSYLPHLLLMLIRSLDDTFVDNMSSSEKVAYKFFLRSYFLNCALNPFVYGACDSRFRSSCKDLFKKIFRRK